MAASKAPKPLSAASGHEKPAASVSGAAPRSSPALGRDRFEGPCRDDEDNDRCHQEVDRAAMLQNGMQLIPGYINGRARVGNLQTLAI